MYLDQVRKGGERTTTTTKVVKEKLVNLTASQTMSLPSSLLELKQKRGQIKKDMKKLFWSNMNYFFQPQTHCFKFQLPSNKKFITCANFSNTNIHFYNAKGEAIFTHSQTVFRGFGAHFKGRSQCQKETEFNANNIWHSVY